MYTLTIISQPIKEVMEIDIWPPQCSKKISQKSYYFFWFQIDKAFAAVGRPGAASTHDKLNFILFFMLRFALLREYLLSHQNE